MRRCCIEWRCDIGSCCVDDCFRVRFVGGGNGITVGPVSGCHINPAITIGVWLNGGLSVMEAGVYIVAQVTGGITGSALLWLIGTMGDRRYGANGLEEPYLLAHLFAEAVLFTFIFIADCIGHYRPG